MDSKNELESFNRLAGQLALVPNLKAFTVAVKNCGFTLDSKILAKIRSCFIFYSRFHAANAGYKRLKALVVMFV